MDKSDFSLQQLFPDDISTNVLDVNYNMNFIFAYQINPLALIMENIP